MITIQHRLAALYLMHHRLFQQTLIYIKAKLFGEWIKGKKDDWNVMEKCKYDPWGHISGGMTGL